MVDNTSPADVNAEISDGQLDAFFNSGGEIETEAPAEEKNQEIDATADEESPSEQENSEDGSEQQVDAHKQDKKVPYGALHEERERRKELQRKVEESDKKVQRMEDRFQKMMDQLSVNQQHQQQIDPYLDDPIGTIRSKQENLERFLFQQAKEHHDQQNMQVAQNQFLHRYNESAKAFLQEKPDFKEAYQHLVDSRIGEYMEAGYSKEQAAYLINQDEASIVAKSYEDGVNPAERMYKLAKVRGYQFKAQNPQNNAQANEEKINQLQKGLQASKSLSNASGKTSKSDMRLEDIAALPDDEFSKVDWKKVMQLG